MLRKFNALLIIPLLLIFAAPAAGQQPVASDLPELTLAQAIELALAHNLGLEGALYQQQAARWGMWYSIAGYMPSAGFYTTYTRLDQETVDEANQGGSYIEQIAESLGIDYDSEPTAFEDNYSSNIQVVQPLFNGGAEIAAIRLARAARSQADFGYDEQLLATVRDVKTAYFKVLQAAALKRVSTDGLDLAQETLRMFNAQFEVGQVSRSEVLRWEAQTAQAEGALIEAEAAYELSLIDLANLLGVELTARYRLPELKLEIDPQLYQAVRAELQTVDDQAKLNELLQSHPAIQGMQQTVKMQCSNVQMAWSMLLPKLNFAYTYSWPADETIDLEGDQYWTAMVQLEVPLFTGFRALTSIGKERSNLRRSRVELRDFERGFSQQVYGSRLQLNTAYRKLEAARKQEDYAGENLRNVQGRQELGLSSNLELLDAQVTYNSARADMVKSVSDYYIALALWEYVNARNY